jgi:hypothetical protein
MAGKGRGVEALNSVSGLVLNRSVSTNQNVPFQNQMKRCTRYTLREVMLSTNHSTVHKKDESFRH